MDILFKTIAYGLRVDVRESYDLEVNMINVHYGDSRDVSSDMDERYSSIHPKPTINRVIFKSTGFMSECLPIADKVKRVLIQSPDIEIYRYKDAVFSKESFLSM